MRTGDINGAASVRAALDGVEFDVVVNFLGFTDAQAAQSVALFAGRTAEYVHVSTATMYHKPVRLLPIVESSARHNPSSRHAHEKIAIAAADELLRAPSPTYNKAHRPPPGDWTVVDWICRGDELVASGHDGTSLWTLTHAADFAVGLTGLLGSQPAIGEVLRITSDDVLTWNQIYETIARPRPACRPG